MVDLIEDEATRVVRLLDAQAKAERLFAEVTTRGVVRPGSTEREASDAVRDLAADLFGISRWWHKRIVRAGPHTLMPYADNPPDRVLAEDDIVFLDFGPLLGQWEADFGRTFVLGVDPAKVALAQALPRVWAAGRAAFEASADITGEALFAHMHVLAREAGWEFGGAIAGHLIGQFPHEKIAGDEVDSYVMPGSVRPMRRADARGLACHWILEVHLVDRAGGFGGFHEELLDLADPAAPRA